MSWLLSLGVFFSSSFILLSGLEVYASLFTFVNTNSFPLASHCYKVA